MQAVLDTNLLIDALAARPDACRWLDTLHPGDGLFSAVTLCELLAGTHPHQEDRLNVFLGALRMCEVTVAVAREAGRLRREYGPAGLDVPDALIAATAVVHRAALVTRDAIFSRIPGLRVERW